MTNKAKLKKNRKVINKNTIDKLWYALPLLTIIGLGLSSFGIGDNLVSRSLNQKDFFSDFSMSIFYSQFLFGPFVSATETFSYFLSPFSVVFFKLLLYFINSNTMYYILRTSVIIIFFIIFIRFGNNFRLNSILLFSSPFLFLIGRGNPDIFIIILMIFAINAIERKKIYSFIASLSLATAIKFPEGILGLSLLTFHKKKIRNLSLMMSFSLLFYTVPLFFNSFSFQVQLTNFFLILKRYTRDYVIGDGGTLYNNSVFGMAKTIVYLFSGSKMSTEKSLQIGEFIHKIYYPTIGILLIIVFFYLLAKYRFELFSMGTVEALYLATILLILLPEISSLYRLTLLAPFIIYFQKIDCELVNMRIFVLMNVLPFSPKNFIRFDFGYEPSGITLDSLVNPVLLIVILFVSVKSFLKIGIAPPQKFPNKKAS